MKALLVIALSGIFTQNFVLTRTLGICPFLGVSKKLRSAVGMSLAVTFVMVLAAAVTWPIQHWVLDRFGIGYMQTIIFILVIAALVQLVEMILKKHAPGLHRSLGVYLPLITTNCAVLGIAVLNVREQYTFAESLVSAAGAGLGFLLAMVLFAGVRGRIDRNDIPQAFRGLPVTMIAAAIVSMSFMGFGGVVDGLLF